jgi:4-amino-4-deoxy-L-arabinose transferase-like glycosyltransferase
VVALAAKTQLRTLRRLAVSPWAVTLCAVGVGGIALRVWVYRSALGTPDADEGVVGLVARHILDGQFPTFIWGLFYGGIQELLLTAPIFWIFGSSWLALRIVPMLITAVTTLLIWRIGRRTIGEPGATVAAALFWVWPPYDLYQLTHQHGYYASDTFYCALYILLALRVVERPSTARVGVFGLVLGLGFWQTSHSVPIMVGAIAWTIWRRPEALRKLWAAVPLAAIGALPWIIWNIKHDWASVNVSYSAESTYWHRLRIFLSPLMPMIVGIRHIGTQARVLPGPLTWLLLLLLAGVFAYGALRSIRRDVSVLYVVAIIFPFIYAISGFTIESSDPRYLVVLTPVLPLLFAQLATTRIRGTALVALGALVSIVILHTAIVQHPPEVDPPRDFRPLIATLDRLDVHYVYSSHWVAYRLAFETNERIIGVKNDWSHGVHWDGTQATPGPDLFIRYPPWERAVAEHRHAFVFYRDALPPIVPDLRRFGYRHYDVGTLVVYALK